MQLLKCVPKLFSCYLLTLSSWYLWDADIFSSDRWNRSSDSQRAETAQAHSGVPLIPGTVHFREGRKGSLTPGMGSSSLLLLKKASTSLQKWAWVCQQNLPLTVVRPPLHAAFPSHLLQVVWSVNSLLCISSCISIISEICRMTWAFLLAKLKSTRATMMHWCLESDWLE